MLELLLLPLTLIPLLLGIALFGAVVWLLLIIFEPLFVWIKAGIECDKKYASDRERRAAYYENMHNTIYNCPEVHIPSNRELKRQHKLEMKVQRRMMKKVKEGVTLIENSNSNN